jgi:hypothetical protein
MRNRRGRDVSSNHGAVSSSAASEPKASKVPGGCFVPFKDRKDPAPGIEEFLRARARYLEKASRIDFGYFNFARSGSND